jgi:excinuclease ABC subunit B
VVGHRLTTFPDEAAANFDVSETIRELEEEMLTAANNLEFEKAALLRDQVRELKRQFGQTTGPARALAGKAATAVSCGKGKRRK